MNTNASLNQLNAYHSILTGSVSEFLDKQEALDAVAKLEAKVTASLASAAKHFAPKTAAPVAKPKTDAQLRTELAVLSGAPVSMNMTREYIEKKIAEIKAEQEAAKPQVTKTPRKPGVGARQIELLKSGMKAEEVLSTIQSEFPDAKTSIKCVYWYASKIRCGQF